MTEEMYKELFADCQRLLLDNLDPPDDAAYWDWLVSQSNYFGDKYGASDFVFALVLAVMDEIDRRYKAKNEEAKDDCKNRRDKIRGSIKSY